MRAMSGGPTPSVRHDAAARRYEIELDGERVGLLRYRLRPGLVALDHTEVDDRFEGRGLGSQLVAYALDDARERGLGVLPFCPFVSEYMRRHREYAELVPTDRREAFGL
jgi:predicted GNAT family acetyltransferase